MLTKSMEELFHTFFMSNFKMLKTLMYVLFYLYNNYISLFIKKCKKRHSYAGF